MMEEAKELEEMLPLFTKVRIHKPFLENLPQRDQTTQIAQLLRKGIKGIHIYGERGSGKTTCCIQALHECKTPFLFTSCSTSDTIDGFWSATSQYFSSAKGLHSVLHDKGYLESQKFDALCEVLKENGIEVLVFDNLESTSSSFKKAMRANFLSRGLKVVTISENPEGDTSINLGNLDSVSATHLFPYFPISTLKSLELFHKWNIYSIKLLSILFKKNPDGKIDDDIWTVIWRAFNSQQRNIALILSILTLAFPKEFLQDDQLLGALFYREREDEDLYLMHKSAKEFLISKVEDMKDLHNEAARWLEEKLNTETKSLLKGAKLSLWPFIPEPYQYPEYKNLFGKFASSESLLIAINPTFKVKELEILLIYFWHSSLSKNWRAAASALFLTDRYLYRLGKPNELLSLIEFISRKTEISQQLHIRKGRLLKHVGSFQQADTLLLPYSTSTHPTIVKAVSLQIRTEIAVILSNFEIAEKFIQESVGIMRKPVEINSKGEIRDHPRDTKGEGYGLALHGDILLRRGKLEESINCYREAIEVSGEKRFEGSHRRRLGFALWQIGNNKDAVEALRRSLKDFEDCAKLPESRQWYFEYSQSMFYLSLLTGSQKEFQSASSYFGSQCGTWIAIKRNEIMVPAYETISGKETIAPSEKETIVLDTNTPKEFIRVPTPFKSVTLQEIGNLAVPFVGSDLQDVHVAWKCSCEYIGEPNFKWESSITLVKIEKAIYQSGSTRNCFKAWELTQEDPGATLIAKNFKTSRKYEDYFKEVHSTTVARWFTIRFNEILSSKSDLASWELSYVPAWVLKVNDGYYGLEPEITIYKEVTKFTKLTNNGTYAKQSRSQESKNITDIATAFSHFTYEHSNKSLMVTDIQGWITKNRLLLTDPQIHSKGSHFSIGDRAESGFYDFFASQHPECNEFCRALKLTSVPSKLLEELEISPKQKKRRI